MNSYFKRRTLNAWVAKRWCYPWVQTCPGIHILGKLWAVHWVWSFLDVLPFQDENQLRNPEEPVTLSCHTHSFCYLFFETSKFYNNSSCHFKCIPPWGNFSIILSFPLPAVATFMQISALMSPLYPEFLNDRIFFKAMPRPFHI